MRPLQRHVQAISDFPPPPQDVKQLQQFLGIVNFYRRFLPGIARTLQLLTDALKGAPKTLEWLPAAAAAFGSAKAALAAPIPLAHPASNAMLSLATDASDKHVGGVLQQLTSGKWQPLAFSKKLLGEGTRYYTFNRELLAAFSAVRHFRFLLEGRQFRLLTDHKPLLTSLFRTTPPRSARQQRQLSFITEFTSDIRHTPVQENVVADALSRPPSAAAQPPPLSQRPPPALTAEDWPEEGLAALDQPILAAIADAQPVDFSAMAAAQRSCPEVAEMMNSSTLQITTQTVGDTTLLGESSDPPPHRRPVLLATDGQGLSTVPAGQGSQTRTPATNRDTSTSPPFRPPQRGPGRAAAAFARPHLPVHHHRPDIETLASITVADCARASSLAGYHASEYQPPSLQTEGPNSRPPFGRACVACSTSIIRPRQHTSLSQTGWSSGSTGD